MITTTNFLTTICTALALAASSTTLAQDESQILFTNVNVFDGFSDELANGMSVLIEEN